MRSRCIPENVFVLRRGPDKGLQAELRENIAAAVLDGRLTPGARLPSTRGLARHLGISRITVTLAYEELVMRGQLEVASRSGYRVAAPTARAPATPPDWEARLGRRWSMLLPEPGAAARTHPYPFLPGRIEPSPADAAAWRDCLERARADGEAAEDDPTLPDLLRARILPRRGIEARAGEVLVTSGAAGAAWIAAQLLLRQGAHAACENPCRPELHAALRLTGARVTPLAVDALGLRPEALPAGLDAVFVTPGHQVPTAAAMPLPRREALLAAARRHGFAIVEDDRDAAPDPREPAAPALKSLDAEGRVLHVGELPGALPHGAPLGWLVAPAPLIREARALGALAACLPSALAQRAAAHLIALGQHDAPIRRVREALAARHRVMEAALRREGLRIAGAADGVFWIEGPAGLDAAALAAALRQDGVLIEPGGRFFPLEKRPCRHFRLGCSAIAVERIADGVALIARRLRAMSGRGEGMAWAAE